MHKALCVLDYKTVIGWQVVFHTIVALQAKLSLSLIELMPQHKVLAYSSLYRRDKVVLFDVLGSIDSVYGTLVDRYLLHPVDAINISLYACRATDKIQ